MQNRQITMMPTIIDGAEFSLLRIPTRKLQEQDISQESFHNFDHAKPIGISPGYSAAGKLVALAIADDKTCTIVEFTTTSPRSRDTRNRNKAPLQRNLTYLEQGILCRPAGDLFAFDMGPLALSLYYSLDGVKLRITRAVDIQSGLSAMDRKPLTAIKEILGSSAVVKEQNIKTVFYYPIYDPKDSKSATDLAQRAWISQLLATYGNGEITLGKVPRIDTVKMNNQKLDTLAKISIDALRQDLIKPTRTKHEVEFISNGQEPSKALSQKFSNKLRNDQQIRMVTQTSSGGIYTTRGEVGRVSGKSAPLSTNRPLDGKTITNIISIGRDDPTTAEAQRAATVLRVLQGHEQLMDNSPWIKNIFYPDDNTTLLWPSIWSEASDSLPMISNSAPSQSLRLLNPSQQHAVNAMCSSQDSDRITLIQGPPGTGKTSVIASFVQLTTQMGQHGIWLVAQSNVAVKNIAEKLMKVHFLDWRLLVSKDFIFEWHEHIYASELNKNIIWSNNFKFISSKDIKGCSVILCTLSMLSNKYIGKFTAHNPVKTLIVDEASQIENILELEAVIKLAQGLQEQQRSYQIITPYDAQRSAIELKMKQTAGLEWKNNLLTNW
ncbi:hypothetical protein H0H92_005205 [Tricholoma furcatifolium]|nr:hypothetical protein H0H92_005205 [Tricholoma furcatifolium]